MATWYLNVLWHHDLDEPVELYSEIGDDQYEIRKVERYRDGRLDYADEYGGTGTTLLSEKPIPSMVEIAAQAEFSPSTIERAEFEAIWSRAHQGR